MTAKNHFVSGEMMKDKFLYQELLGVPRRRTMAFSEFVDGFLTSPRDHLKTSATLIAEAIRHFGFEIVVRSGEPTLSYKIFKDLFSNGVNAVYGQELCIKHIVDVITSVDKEAGPKRGIVLFGPPASGKTNIVDLISQALEEYTKDHDVKLYSFFFRFCSDNGRVVDVRSSFMHHPLLLFPLTLQLEDGETIRPRQELFDHISTGEHTYTRTPIPTYFQYASLDKRSLDILEALRLNPRNENKTLFDIIEEYVCIEELEFSNAQAKGIANIDAMSQLAVRINPSNLGSDDMAVLNAHLPDKFLFHYEGAMLSSNRGMLHIHDAFGVGNSGGPKESDYKPLLMLLGSGKISLESTQASLDNTVIMTTNLEEIDMLDHQLTAAKLLDRIVRIPVNYLLDSVAEMDILKRDLSNIQERCDLDPNLMRVAAQYSVMTRLMAPRRQDLPEAWCDEKKELYRRITPEQKLMIYSSQSDDPVNTIRRLPHWHPFRNECLRVGINVFEPDFFRQYLIKHPEAVSLDDCGLFTRAELKHIDDEFMRLLRSEHYPEEGRHGLSIRQLQNIMRNTIASSNGTKITVELFLAQLSCLIAEGPSVHHWLVTESAIQANERQPVRARAIGNVELGKGEGDYDDVEGLVKVAKGIYHTIIKREITVATVDREPDGVEFDLRKYLQQVLLAKAIDNRAFSHILVPRYVYIDPESGEKIDRPDPQYMKSIENVIANEHKGKAFRDEMAQKFLDLQDAGELSLQDGCSVTTSRDDNLLSCFSKEYTALLSHRKEVDGISPDMLREAFFHRRSSPEQYRRIEPQVAELVSAILSNMTRRFSYSPDTALDTVIYALREDVIDFAKIIR